MQNLSFENKVVVVTGAGNGLGRAYALELARRGAQVVVNDLGGKADGHGSDTSAAAQVVEEIRRAGGAAVANTRSVADTEGGRSIVEDALSAFGRLDAVIANAGFLRDRSFAKLDLADLDALVAVHLRGSFAVLQPAFQHMKQTGTAGRLVLTTSASGLFGMFGQSGYASAKMGVVGLAKTLAIEGQSAGIKVNAVAPVAATRLTGEVAQTADDPMSPSRVASIVVALAHESCPASGETFLATGSWFSRAFVGLGDGWRAGERSPSAEDVAANWPTIRSIEGWCEPADANAIGELMEGGPGAART